MTAKKTTVVLKIHKKWLSENEREAIAVAVVLMFFVTYVRVGCGVKRKKCKVAASIFLFYWIPIISALPLSRTHISEEKNWPPDKINQSCVGHQDFAIWLKVFFVNFSIISTPSVQWLMFKNKGFKCHFDTLFIW